MIIKKSEFLYSMASYKDYREHSLPEIAIVGKSNVGKSSLINYVLGSRKLARTSSSPGKTRLVNFFKVNDAFCIVDLPGYGYAKVSKDEQAKWGKMMEEYFARSAGLKHMLLLLDIRHAPTELDGVMHDWIKHYNIPYSIVLTKCDKIAKTRLRQYYNVIKQKLNIADEIEAIYFSVPMKKGKEEILQVFDSIIE